MAIFVGLMAPKQAPSAIVDKLHNAINKIMARPKPTFITKLGDRSMIASRAEFTKIPAERHRQADKLG